MAKQISSITSFSDTIMLLSMNYIYKPHQDVIKNDQWDIKKVSRKYPVETIRGRSRRDGIGQVVLGVKRDHTIRLRRRTGEGEERFE
jgi:hypothetical protein